MTSEAIKTQVEFERLKDFFNVLPAISVGGFFAVLIVSAGLFKVLPITYIGAWLAFAFSVFCFRMALMWVFRRTDSSAIERHLTRWQFLIALSSTLSGASWGAVGFIFYGVVPESYHIYIVGIILGVSSGYFPMMMHYDKCFYGFFIPSISPLIIALFFAEGEGTTYVAFMLFAHFCLVLTFARWFYLREFDRIYLKYSLYEQNKKVKAANDSKSKFLASASHDLRQPLQALGFYIVMLSDFLREPNKKVLFDKTLGAYRALEDLLNQLLNVSKLNANMVDVQKTHFSISALFDKLKNEYEMQAINKGLEIHFVTDDFFAHSDSVCVERIIRNLLENALRYTESGSIKVSCREQGEQLLLEVADTGPGIENEHVDKIFDEFYQIKNPERDRSKGFGLGLYAVSRLAALLGTQVKVKSQVGQGSAFSIALDKGLAGPQIKPFDPSDTVVRGGVLVDKIVLIVDDDPVVLDSLYRLFVSWSCQVLPVSSRQEAIDLVVDEEMRPDFLVMDYRLPDYVTGVSLVKELRKLCGYDMPAVILTGDTGEESLNDISGSGLPFLHKPTDPNKLKEQVMRLLSAG